MLLWLISVILTHKILHQESESWRMGSFSEAVFIFILQQQQQHQKHMIFFKRQKWSLNICTFINHLQTTEYPNRLRDVCRPNRPICFLFSSFWSFNCDNVALHILMMRIMEALVEISIWSAQTAFHLPAQQQNTHSKCKSCFYKALIPHIWHWKSNGVHISINNNILQVQNLVYYCL